MKREFLITITDVDSGKEVARTKRTMAAGSNTSEERVVYGLRSSLHDGLDWMKAQLTEEAVHMLLFGKPEPEAIADVNAYVAEDIQFSVDFEVPVDAALDEFRFAQAQAVRYIATHILGAGHDTKDFVFANLPLPALEGMKRYRHAARRRP